jgi:hypothetical protein
MPIQPITLKIDLQKITVNFKNVEQFRNIVEALQLLKDAELFEDDSVYSEVSKGRWRTTEDESSEKLIEYLEGEIHKIDLIKLADWNYTNRTKEN